MLSWILALVAGLALAALAYRVRPAAPAATVFALRAFAGTVMVALLLDAPLGPSRPLAPWVGLDVSASWRASGDPAQWATARALVDSLRSAGADSVILFGDSLRSDTVPTIPHDVASRVGPLVDAAIAAGRPLVLVTDGLLDDPERIARLPRGSQIRVVPAAARPDAAIALLDAPGGALGGDTVPVRIVMKAGAAGSLATALELRLDDRVITSAPVSALEAFEEHEVRVAVPVPASDGTRRLRTALVAGSAPAGPSSTAGSGANRDAVAENDTASAPLVVSGAAAATFISSAPDQDARFALAVLRGTRRGPVQAFWRVAPGQWRIDGSLLPATEAAVRQAAAAAPLLVLHGDTALFGTPRALGRGALVLFAPPAAGEDYYPAGTGDSPLSAVLSGVPWDSLPPLDVAPMAPRGAPAVIARRARRFEERTVFHLDEGPRRTVIVPASGLWRWRLRGGRASDAFDAVWGSVFDWVGAEARNGAPVEARARASAEWVPRRATVASGAIGDGVPMDRAPRALTAWWLAAAAIIALCAEWLLRRKIGLR